MTDGAAPSDVGFGTVDDDRTARHCYRALVDAVDGSVFRLDADARLVAIDDALVERTGEDRDALIGEHVARLVSADERSESVGGTITVDAESGDGSTLTVTLSAVDD